MDGCELAGFRATVRRVLVVLVAVCASSVTSAALGAGTTPQRGECSLLLDTTAGTIRAELFPAAAPQAVAMLVRRVAGPAFDPAMAAETSTVASVGYYDGLTFDDARPHVKLMTAERQPAGPFRLPLEIDAAALGLDRAKIVDHPAAMEVVQQELIPAWTDAKTSGGVNPKLQKWIELWFRKLDPDFLIGVSRMQVNEALGWAYRKGYASRPAPPGAARWFSSRRAPIRSRPASASCSPTTRHATDASR